MNKHTIKTPSAAPIAALVILFLCVATAALLYYFNGPVFLAFVGLPLVFYMAGRESEWTKQRKHEQSLFKQDLAPQVDEFAATNTKVERFLKELHRIREEEGTNYSTMSSPTV